MFSATEEKARALISALNDRMLCRVMADTNKKRNTADLITVRGWLMDEIEARLGREKFEAWLDTEAEQGRYVNPWEFFKS